MGIVVDQGLPNYPKNKLQELVDKLPDSLEQVFGKHSEQIRSSLLFIIRLGEVAIRETNAHGVDLSSLSLDEFYVAASNNIPRNNVDSLRLKFSRIADISPDYILFNREKSPDSSDFMSVENQYINDVGKLLDNAVTNIQSTKCGFKNSQEFGILQFIQGTISDRCSAIGVAYAAVEKVVCEKLERDNAHIAEIAETLRKLGSARIIIVHAAIIEGLVPHRKFIQGLLSTEDRGDSQDRLDISEMSQVEGASLEVRENAQLEKALNLLVSLREVWHDANNSQARIELLEKSDNLDALELVILLRDLTVFDQTSIDAFLHHQECGLDLSRMIRRARREQIRSQVDEGALNERDLAAQIHKDWPYAFLYTDGRLTLSEVFDRMNRIAALGWRYMDLNLDVQESYSRHKEIVIGWLEDKELLRITKEDYEVEMSRLSRLEMANA